MSRPGRWIGSLQQHHTDQAVEREWGLGACQDPDVATAFALVGLFRSCFREQQLQDRFQTDDDQSVSHYAFSLPTQKSWRAKRLVSSQLDLSINQSPKAQQKRRAGNKGGPQMCIVRAYSGVLDSRKCSGPIKVRASRDVPEWAAYHRSHGADVTIWDPSVPSNQAPKT